MEVDGELPIHIFPPNKILDSNQVKHNKQPEVHPYLCHLDANEDGKFLVTSNDLTGRIWNGAVLFCENVEDACNLKYKETFVSEYGISTAKFLTRNCILVGENSPSLSLIEPQEDIDACRVLDTYLLDERVLDSCIVNKQKAVTCSESVVIVWSLINGGMKPVQEFPSYGMQQITSVSAMKHDENLFMTTDSYGMAMLWDLRLSRPAKVVYHNEFSRLSCVDASRSDRNVVAVGSDNGDVYLLDLRQPNCFMAKDSLPRDVRVHNVKFSDRGLLAVCADANYVNVYSMDMKAIFSDNSSHTMFVRDLLWSNGDLMSCGFDKKVIRHKLD